MIPEGNGRHCMSCCKTVVDFTSWEPADIVQYIKEKGQGNVCGHFKKQQLNVPIETPETLAIKIWNTPVPLYRKIAAVIIIFFGVTIASCNTNEHTSSATSKPGDSSIPATQQQLLGEPVMPQPIPDTIKEIEVPKISRSGIDYGQPYDGGTQGGAVIIEHVDPAYKAPAVNGNHGSIADTSASLQTVNETMHFDPQFSSVDSSK